MRSRIRIIADLLILLEQSTNGLKITELVRKSNVPYVRLTEILEELNRKGIIKLINGEEGQVYIITRKGLKFLEEYRKFSKFVEGFGLEI
ncbi:MAG: hypothetical protein GU362_07005 [Thaumarchaeota archaeon]|jgi:predicted transcriptional regulator|nr:hypothetical protein [Nitrososphaerota archaeon]